MTIHTHTLSNGLRIIHREFPSEVSYFGIAINTGTRDEFPDEYGMAHFVEHMLFKGTKHRKAHHIINRMENVGGDLNAYTTKEETFIYATFLKEFYPRAVELLSDLIFNSVFQPQQINREREVILDEIDSYEDSPSELIFDDFENLMFRNHEIGHNILGSEDSLKDFTTESLKEFVARQYHPSNMVLFSFGKTPFAKVVKYTEKYFNIYAERVVKKQRVAPGINNPVSQTIRKNTVQTHVMQGWQSFSMFDSKKYTLYLVNSILGGGSMNSRLNSSLREKNGLVYHVESNLAFYTDTGLFSIYFACDPKFKDRCIRLINKEIKKIKGTELTPMQLSTAKRQWKGQLGIASEINENSALSMAKRFLHFNSFSSLEEIFYKVDEITSQDVKNVANELFSTRPFELIYE